jgi:hypothetical protein
VQIICFGWVWGVEKGAAELDQGALMKIPRSFLFIMKYVAPAYLLVVLVGFILSNGRTEAIALKDNSVALWTVGIIGAVVALLILLVAVGERRWRAAGLDLDGQQERRS